MNIREDIENIIRSNRRTPAGDVTDKIFKRLGLTDKEIEELNKGGEIRVATKDQEMPFARVDIKDRPEVGRWYDGYKASQDDMKSTGFVKCVGKEAS